MSQPLKTTLEQEKPITTKDFYTALAMAAYIISSNGHVDKDYVKKESESWASFMMS